MTNPYYGAQIDWSPLSQIGESLAGGLSKRWGNQNMESAIKKATTVDGTVDFSKAYDLLAQAGDRENMLALSKMAEMTGEGTAERFGMQVYFGEDGTPYQPSNRGGMRPSQLPPGVRIKEPHTWVNQGTQFSPAPKNMVPGTAPSMPINVAAEAEAKATGGARGAAAASVPDVIANAKHAVETIDEALAHPGRATATGKSSVFDPRSYTPGTEAKSYQVGPMRKIRGQAFLGSIQQMRGLGQLSNAEGDAAREAYLALDTAQTDEDHTRSLYTMKALQLRGVIRAHEKGGMQIPDDIVAAWADAERQSGLGAKVPFQAGVSDALIQDGPATGNESPYPEAGPRPTTDDMQKLQRFQADPAFREAFEQKYGPGSVDRWLVNDGWTGR
jgi:hypothetical protein